MSRALLNAKWDVLDARLADEAAERALLPEAPSEEEIARVAVEMTGEADGGG